MKKTKQNVWCEECFNYLPNNMIRTYLHLSKKERILHGYKKPGPEHAGKCNAYVGPKSFKVSPIKVSEENPQNCSVLNKDNHCKYYIGNRKHIEDRYRGDFFDKRMDRAKKWYWRLLGYNNPWTKWRKLWREFKLGNGDTW